MAHSGGGSQSKQRRPLMFTLPESIFYLDRQCFLHDPVVHLQQNHLASSVYPFSISLLFTPSLYCIPLHSLPQQYPASSTPPSTRHPPPLQVPAGSASV